MAHEKRNNNFRYSEYREKQGSCIFSGTSLKGLSSRLPTLQQATESVQTAMSRTQASPSTFLPFWAHQQDQMNLPCHRAFLCVSPQRSVPPSTPLCHYWGDGQRVPWHSPSPGGTPHLHFETGATGELSNRETTTPSWRLRKSEEASDEVCQEEETK